MPRLSRLLLILVRTIYLPGTKESQNPKIKIRIFVAA